MGRYYIPGGAYENRYKPDKQPAFQRDLEEQPLTESEIDIIRESATVGCTEKEIAHLLGFRYGFAPGAPKTIQMGHDAEEYNRKNCTWFHVKEHCPFIEEVIAKARSVGIRSIRMAQFKYALAGDSSLLMWLGKCLCSQNPVSAIDVGLSGGMPSLADISDEAKQHLIALRDCIYSDSVQQAETTTVVKNVVELSWSAPNGDS
jgi:hypothetical protein